MTKTKVETEETVVVAEQDSSILDSVSVVNELPPDETPQIQAQSKAPMFTIEYPSEQKHFIKLLIHGAYGVGKTYLAGTAQDVPAMKNTMNIDAEGGNKVLAYRGDIPSIKIRNYVQFNAIYEYLRAHCIFRDNNDMDMLKQSEAYFRQINVKKIKEPKIYNTVIIDSISEVVRYCMMMAKNVDIENTRIDSFINQTEWSDRNKVTENILLLIRKFRDLPMHVIFVSSCKFNDKMGQFTPNIEGQLGIDIQGFMDHVGYYTSTIDENNEEHRYLILRPRQNIQAKNRFPNFTQSFLKDPIMADIYDLEVLNKSLPSRITE
jgi:hypothetical protein